MKENNSKLNYKVLLSALILIVAAVSAVALTYARYQKNSETNLQFTVGEAATFDILSNEEWVKTKEGGRKLTFSVTNLNNAKDSAFTIGLLSTIGLKPESAQVTLAVTNNSGVERAYTGVATEITDDQENENDLFDQMGPGYTYKFFDENGNEPVWELAGGAETTENFTLEVSGFSDVCLIELVVSQASQQ